MFTGIVQQRGTLASCEKTDGDLRLVVSTPQGWPGRARSGDSVAVNGVCLTVTEQRDAELVFDVSAETLSKTTFDSLQPGAAVNLEPALSAADPVGGHFVTGHVDTVAKVVHVEPQARSHRLQIRVPHEFARYIASKGCVTVDGVSLTVNKVDGATFDVNIVPHTWTITTLGDSRVGTRVNIEVDLMARYLERLLGERDAPATEPDITTDFLSQQGFEPPRIDDEADADRAGDGRKAQD